MHERHDNVVVIIAMFSRCCFQGYGEGGDLTTADLASFADLESAADALRPPMLAALLGSDS